MANFTNPLTPISYTNKDFRSIMEELIDLTKKLTNKWDPSITNESDPAMVLLKLDAIIGDKNNYNIDKNILEAFPETLTQNVSARSMYKQLGYRMPWYRSAKTKITIGWIGDELSLTDLITIPKYTMICNEDSSIVYTLIEDVNLTKDDPVAQATVMQGFIEDLVVNGSTDIQLNNLDSNNRIYFGTDTIAQNGIFVSNVNQVTYWEEKDNLQVEHEGNTYYEFGVDLRTNNVYLEFPEDIETLIKNGLNVKYLITSGSKGNLAANQLTKFYNDLSVIIGEESVTLNETNIKMYNPTSTTDDLETGSLSGSDPQTIRDAYKSWKKTVATFNTLVTIRDYINAIYNSGLVSNDIVSDRLTDLQTSYKIITDYASFSSSIIKMEDDEKTGEPKMDPYKLRLYLLHNPGEILDINSYESSFELEKPSSLTETTVKNYLAETKCISHDFEGVKSDIPALFRNVYSLNIKIVPQYYLTTAQIDEVKRNIIQDLWKLLNAHEVEFGSEPEYYLIYDTITNSDERIKLVVLEDFTYTTYATYFDSDANDGDGEFKHIPVSEFNDPYIIADNGKDKLETVLQTLEEPTRFLFIDTSNNNTVYKYTGTKEVNYGKQYLKLDSNPYSTKIQEFRTEILAKNMLAGVTPLYKQKTTFQYTIDQAELLEDKDTSRLTTDLNISPFGYSDTVTPKPTEFNAENNVATYTLKENETLQFLGPSFITDVNYSSYVMFEFIMQQGSGYSEYVAANSNYYNSESTGKHKDREGNVIDDNGSYGYLNSLPVAFNEDTANKDGYITFYYYDPGNSYKLTTVDFNMKDVEKHSVVIKGVTRSIADAFKDGYLSLYTEQNVRRVNANESYQLKEGDAIVFFYKEDSDNDNAPYKYVVYRGTNSNNASDMVIIKPNFTLNATSKENAKVFNLLDVGSGKKYEGTLYAGNSSNGAYNIVQGFYGDNGLSGTKQIDVQVLNEVICNPDTKGYYFITNTISSDNKYYEITLKKPEPKDKATCLEYILGPDEYFIYCDLKGQSYEMLGYGSLIRFINEVGTKLPDSLTLKVEMIDYNDLALNGVNAFITHILTPSMTTDSSELIYPSGYKIILREQKIYNFAKDDQVMFTITDSYNNVTEHTDHPAFEPNKYYKYDENSNKYFLYTGTYNAETKTWTAPTDWNKVTRYYTKNYPIFNSTEWTSTIGLDIKYKTAGSSAFDELPRVNLNSDNIEDNWRAKAILNLNTQSDSAQVLDNSLKQNADGTYNEASRQAIQRLTVNNVSFPTKNKELNESVLQYVLTDVILNKVGGNNVDVTYLNALGERKNIDILVYELLPEFQKPPFSKSGSNILMDVVEGTYTINNIELEDNYNYILGVINNSDSATFSLTGNIGDIVVAEPPGHEEYRFEEIECLTGNKGNYGRGTWYFILRGLTDEGLPKRLPTSLEINVSGNDSGAYIVFEELVKCLPNNFDNDSKNKKAYGIKFQDITKKLSELDTEIDTDGFELHLFKYNHKINEDILIEDPLLAKSFFNENHAFNQYTISKAQMRMSGYNDNDSNIIILNNR